MNTKSTHKPTQDVRVRFAPSPTGYLHVGGVRVAMFNWLFARHTNGKYLVRVEDTDQERSTQEYQESQLASLAWLGLSSDEPVVIQSSRAQEHSKAAHDLIKRGLAYPCFCEPRESQDVMRDLEHGLGNKYDGTCRNKAFTQEDLKRPHAIRFKLPENLGDLEFTDLIRGNIRVKPDQLDDYVIIRRDGLSTYNFCVVLDDIFMNITHVIRGDDHISNTTKQLLIYQALGAKIPVFAHLPLILGKSGNKLSKRDAAVSVEHYREQGFLAGAFFNYLVRLGWSHGDQEIFTRQELIDYFSFDNVGKKGAIFDMQKLEWLNGVYIRQTPNDELLEAIAIMSQDIHKKLCDSWPEKLLIRLLDQYKQRAITLLDLAQDIIAFSHKPASLDISLIKKWVTEKTKDIAQEFREKLLVLDNFTHDTLLALAKDVCKNHDQKLVSLAQPLRLALTGKTQSPGVFELLEILGKEKSSERISEVISIL